MANPPSASAIPRKSLTAPPVNCHSVCGASDAHDVQAMSEPTVPTTNGSVAEIVVASRRAFALHSVRRDALSTALADRGSIFTVTASCGVVLKPSARPVEVDTTSSPGRTCAFGAIVLTAPVTKHAAPATGSAAPTSDPPPLSAAGS